MLIEVRLDPGALRLWQRHLLAELAARPAIALKITALPGRIVWPRGMESLLALEDAIGGRPEGRAAAKVDLREILPLASGSGPADMILDLTNGPAEAGGPPRLELFCDGLPFEAGAIAAVLFGKAPTFETRLGDDVGGAILSRWYPAIETPNRAASALDMLLGRAAEMLSAEIGRLAIGRSAFGRSALAPEPAAEVRRRSPAAFFLRAAEARIAGKLAGLLGRAPDWHVAIRRRQGGDGLPDIGPSGFVRLADDRQRFYADPFLFEASGRTFLFVEEFPYATRRGIISVAEVAADGSLVSPRPVLEGPDHLSYPFVFEEDGVIWMIPETSARRTVELYRADPFPDRWTLDRVLIEGADLSDATLMKTGRHWWLFAASRARWTSSWDALSLYRGTNFRGPWEPHPANPVLVDRRAARPGGRILDIGGRIVRPAQDCEGGYGAGLAFAAIERLDAAGFDQRVIATARPWAAKSGLHSYDRCGAFEAIDLFGPH